MRLWAAKARIALVVDGGKSRETLDHTLLSCCEMTAMVLGEAADHEM